MIAAIPRGRGLVVVVVLLATTLLLAGCGAGTAGIVAGSSGSSGGATPALDAFVVESPWTATATRISSRLTWTATP